MESIKVEKLNKKALKDEITKIKALSKNFSDSKSLFNKLEEDYERITNRNDKNYNDKYNLVEIFKGKTLKEFEVLASKKEGSGVVFEFVKYLNAPNGFVFIYNEFYDNLQTKIDIFIIKENENIID